MLETDFCKIEYMEKYNAVFCRWKRFCRSTDYRAPLEYGLRLIRAQNASMWITDTTNGFENEPEDTQWLLETFIPKVIDSSCESIAFIIDEDSPLKDEIKQQRAALSQYFNVQEADSLEAIH